MEAYENYQYGGWRRNDTIAPLRCAGGECGGGSESIVVEKAGTLVAGYAKCYNDSPLERGYAVMDADLIRRLTPTECERLQGLPDGWTLIDDKSCSDSSRYKAIGNGMAQPCADFILQQIANCEE